MSQPNVGSSAICVMTQFRNAVTVRNILIGAGAYYLAGWLNFVLWFGFGRLTDGIIYSGSFGGSVVMPLVVHFPKALAAFAAGVVVVWLVEAERPTIWVIFPVLLYAAFGFFGYHWERPPVFLDRVAQTIGALFPAITCAIGGIVAAGRRTRPRVAETTSG